MNVAIVGTSHIHTDKERSGIAQLCGHIINHFDKEKTIIISGGAEGVDTIAINMASGLGYITEVFKPTRPYKPFYLERNREIARACTDLFCISIPKHTTKCYHHPLPQDHEKTAGCYTMNEALKLGRNCRFFKVG